MQYKTMTVFIWMERRESERKRVSSKTFVLACNRSSPLDVANDRRYFLTSSKKSRKKKGKQCGLRRWRYSSQWYGEKAIEREIEFFPLGIPRRPPLEFQRALYVCKGNRKGGGIKGKSLDICIPAGIGLNGLSHSSRASPNTFSLAVVASAPKK